MPSNDKNLISFPGHGREGHATSGGPYMDACLDSSGVNYWDIGKKLFLHRKSLQNMKSVFGNMLPIFLMQYRRTIPFETVPGTVNVGRGIIESRFAAHGVSSMHIGHCWVHSHHMASSHSTGN